MGHSLRQLSKWMNVNMPPNCTHVDDSVVHTELQPSPVAWVQLVCERDSVYLHRPQGSLARGGMLSHRSGGGGGGGGGRREVEESEGGGGGGGGSNGGQWANGGGGDGGGAWARGGGGLGLQRSPRAASGPGPPIQNIELLEELMQVGSSWTFGLVGCVVHVIPTAECPWTVSHRPCSGCAEHMVRCTLPSFHTGLTKDSKCGDLVQAAIQRLQM